MEPRKPGTAAVSAKILPFPDPARREDSQKILYLSPEFEGLCLLYAHHALSTDKLYAVRILCWARLADGRDVALVPWLKGIARCTDLNNPESGEAQGYYHPTSDRQFSSVPEHHVQALNALSERGSSGKGIVQEIPDMTGSHAALIRGDETKFHLEPVVSWQLDDTGVMTAMVADQDRATQWPVLPGDDCLYPATPEYGFRYFFQYHIANQIKSGGAMATRALNSLLQT
jgi:hypothetical protein